MTSLDYLNLIQTYRTVELYKALLRVETNLDNLEPTTKCEASR